jgi:hypothetical protein
LTFRDQLIAVCPPKEIFSGRDYKAAAGMRKEQFGDTTFAAHADRQESFGILEGIDRQRPDRLTFHCD